MKDELFINQQLVAVQTCAVAAETAALARKVLECSQNWTERIERLLQARAKEIKAAS